MNNPGKASTDQAVALHLNQHPPNHLSPKLEAYSDYCCFDFLKRQKFCERECRKTRVNKYPSNITTGEMKNRINLLRHYCNIAKQPKPYFVKIPLKTRQ